MNNCPSAPSPRTLSFVAAVLAMAAFALTLVWTSPASAQRELLGKTGEKGDLVLDQLSGFRAGYNGNLQYYGIVGVAVQKSDLGALTQNNGGNFVEGTTTTTTFFLSPSADYFVIDHLSLGGHVELAFGGGSNKVRINQTTTQTFDRPSTTNITLMPRIGYLFPVGDRFAIWPRLGFGYTSQQVVVGTAQTATTEHFGAAIMGVDVGFLYRLNEAVFLRMAPDVTFSLGGSRSQTVGGLTVSTDASVFNFSAVGGIGVFIDLL